MLHESRAGGYRLYFLLFFSSWSSSSFNCRRNDSERRTKRRAIAIITTESEPKRARLENESRNGPELDSEVGFFSKAVHEFGYFLTKLWGDEMGY